MSKKKITGQSKLSKIVAPENATSEMDLIIQKSKPKPVSFLLTSEEKEILQNITGAVDKLSVNKKISKNLVIKSLIRNAQKIKPEKLLELVRETIV